MGGGFDYVGLEFWVYLKFYSAEDWGVGVKQKRDLSSFLLRNWSNLSWFYFIESLFFSFSSRVLR